MMNWRREEKEPSNSPNQFHSLTQPAISHYVRSQDKGTGRSFQEPLNAAWIL